MVHRVRRRTARLALQSLGHRAHAGWFVPAVQRGRSPARCVRSRKAPTAADRSGSRLRAAGCTGSSRRADACRTRRAPRASCRKEVRSRAVPSRTPRRCPMCSPVTQPATRGARRHRSVRSLVKSDDRAGRLRVAVSAKRGMGRNAQAASEPIPRHRQSSLERSALDVAEADPPMAARRSSRSSLSRGAVGTCSSQNPMPPFETIEPAQPSTHRRSRRDVGTAVLARPAPDQRSRANSSRSGDDYDVLVTPTVAGRAAEGHRLVLRPGPDPWRNSSTSAALVPFTAVVEHDGTTRGVDFRCTGTNRDLLPGQRVQIVGRPQTKRR